MISLDGSTLEGGGQLVRVALALSAITSIPVHVYNIRANRVPFSQRRQGGHGSGSDSKKTKKNNDSNKNGSKRRVEGGLKESHLAALLWLADQTDASVQGAEAGSLEVKFKPGNEESKGRKVVAMAPKNCHTIELKNPGSVWLILQAILPYVVFNIVGRAKGQGEDEDKDETKKDKSVQFVLKGGTNVDKSMSGEYVQQVLLPTLQKIGLPANVQIDIMKRGWVGAAKEIGEVRVSVAAPDDDDANNRPGSWNGFQVVDRGNIEKIGVSIVAHPESLRQQVIHRVQQQANERFGHHVKVETVVDDDSGDGSRFYLLLVAHTANGWRVGRDFLGTGAKIRTVAQVESLVETSVRTAVDDLDTEVKRGGCVDEHLQDQLVIFQALAGGKSVVDAGEGDDAGKGTLHTQTVRWVCKEVLGVQFGEHGLCEGRQKVTEVT